MEDWYNALKRDKPDLVDISGGEPLFISWIPNLMRAASSIYFGLSTNGLAQTGIKNLCENRIPNLVSINVSVHPSSKIVGAFERWKISVLSLMAAGYSVHCNIVDAPGNVDAASESIRWMQENDVHFEVSPYEKVSDLGVMMKSGLLCEGGINHLVVAPDGTAWPCLTTLRSPYYKNTSLGNWLDNTIDIRRKPQPCYLNCTDYYVLAKEHTAGDMWNVQARPAEGK